MKGYRKTAIELTPRLVDGRIGYSSDELVDFVCDSFRISSLRSLLKNWVVSQENATRNLCCVYGELGEIDHIYLGGEHFVDFLHDFENALESLLREVGASEIHLGELWFNEAYLLETLGLRIELTWKA